MAIPGRRRERDSQTTDDYQGTMTEAPNANRRTVLRTIGGGLLAGAIAVPASAGDDELSTQLNRVRARTRRYRDLETARNEGYVAISPYVPGDGISLRQRGPTVRHGS